MAKMGRPKKEIDQNQFEKLCQFFCTLDDIAGFFDCSQDTIERWCKETYDETFAEVYKKRSGIGRISLRRWQYQAAERGNTAMLIWLGKQHLNQKDKTEIGGDELRPIVLKYNLDDCDDEKPE